MSEANLEPRSLPSGPQAVRDKGRVAATSVVAAVFLTTIKIVVGVMTGSLGILSEAAHSALDLVAAAVTWLAVRVSAKPADREHTYGHGKIENLSALFETALLLATCGWIIFEAVNRLFFKTVVVEASAWAFAVMAISIVIDLSRSRALLRVAKKYSSQALEADALHFSTDVWSSSVVIIGLLGVLLSRRPGLEWLLKADAVAALGVAAIVVWISVQLGRKTVVDLLDQVPPGLRDDLERAVQLPGVAEVRRVRVRRAGPESFADVTLAVDKATPLARAHEIATSAEAAARRLLPGADVVVHVEPVQAPARGDERSLIEVAHSVATEMGLAAHDIYVHHVMGSRSVELHLEVDAQLSLAVAHEKATAFETSLRRAVPDLGQVVTHIEPRDLQVGVDRPEPGDEEQVLAVLHDLARENAFRCNPHQVTVHRTGGELSVSFHCALEADIGITAAHELTERVERALRSRLPGLGRVVIHVEPLVKPS